MKNRKIDTHTHGLFCQRRSTDSQLFQAIELLNELVQEVQDHSKAPVIFDKRDTKLYHPDVEGISEQLIYEIFICCYNLTIELPAPKNFAYIFSEKPAEFPQTTIEEQIKFLKKDFSISVSLPVIFFDASAIMSDYLIRENGSY